MRTTLAATDTQRSERAAAANAANAAENEPVTVEDADAGRHERGAGVTATTTTTQPQFRQHLPDGLRLQLQRRQRQSASPSAELSGAAAAPSNSVGASSASTVLVPWTANPSTAPSIPQPSPTLPAILHGAIALPTTPPSLAMSASAFVPSLQLLFVSGGFLDPALVPQQNSNSQLQTPAANAGAANAANASASAAAGQSAAQSTLITNSTAPCQNQLLIYSIQMRIWFRPVMRMPVGLCGHTLTYSNNALWFIGGATSIYLRGPGTDSSLLYKDVSFNGEVISYNFASDDFSRTTPNLPINSYNHVTETDGEGNFFVLGGQTSTLNPISKMTKLMIASDGSLATGMSIDLKQYAVQRTMASSATIISNFYHKIMFVYGGYTVGSTQTSANILPLLQNNWVYAFDMTLGTTASTYITYFQPFDPNFQKFTTDLTKMVAPVNTTILSNATLSTSTSSGFATSVATLTSNASSTETVPTTTTATDTSHPIPPAPTSFQSNSSTSTVLGPCIVNPANCLDFGFASANAGSLVYFYGGGLGNASSTNAFWVLNASVDGMWFWTDLTEMSHADHTMLPAWVGPGAVAVTASELDLVLPYQGAGDLTGGLIRYHLNNMTFDWDRAIMPNISEYYTTIQPPPSSPAILASTTPVAVIIAVTTVVILGALISVFVVRERKRRRRRAPVPIVHPPFNPTELSGGSSSSSVPYPEGRRASIFKTAAATNTSKKMTLYNQNRRRSSTPSVDAAIASAVSSNRTLHGTPPAAIPLTTFSQQPIIMPPPASQQGTPQSQQSDLPRNRLIASWRVLTGAQPISPPPSGSTPPLPDPALLSPAAGGRIPSGGSSSVHSSRSDHQAGGSGGGSSGGGGRASTLFRAPDRTVSSAAGEGPGTGEDAGVDLPSYDAAVGGVHGRRDAAGEGSSSGSLARVIERAGGTGVVEEPAVGEVEDGEAVLQQAVAVGPHSPVGKDEIELRLGDVITLSADFNVNPHSQFVHGLNLNSGRTGLFPRHCIVLASGSTLASQLPPSTDISWWREQAIRFNSVLTNPANGVVAPPGIEKAAGVAALDELVGNTAAARTAQPTATVGTPGVQSPTMSVQGFAGSLAAPLMPPVQRPSAAGNGALQPGAAIAAPAAAAAPVGLGTGSVGVRRGFAAPARLASNRQQPMQDASARSEVAAGQAV
ncbi:hypothetical protein BC830DRAFT_1163575 [Chytriomyces sp. MP71]|nr:hypothetical protein BC830DRAFT_1163575 [Chytriomyces sp. MP71]